MGFCALQLRTTGWPPSTAHVVGAIAVNLDLLGRASVLGRAEVLAACVQWLLRACGCGATSDVCGLLFCVVYMFVRPLCVMRVRVHVPCSRCTLAAECFDMLL
eukprot:3556356-Pleurochrysis_carterae.AAC.3